MIRLTFLYLILAAASSCSESTQVSDAQAVEDIKVLSVRDDGRFDVICRNGSTEIRSANEIRANQVCGGGQHSGFALTCASRDNDRRAPYSFMRITASSSTLLTQLVHGTLDECKSALNAKILAGNSTYLCVSKDRDGRRPYAVGIIDAESAYIGVTVTRDLQECVYSLTKHQIVANTALFCASRDSDGARPFSVYQYRDHIGQRLNSSFSDLGSCTDSISDLH